MNPSLQDLRATASFPARWHLVPLLVSSVAIVAACAAQAVSGGARQDAKLAQVALAAPTLAYSDGA
jgi:hypothetical protein